jgi:hypothetical protein
MHHTHLSIQLGYLEPVAWCHCLPLAVNELLKLQATSATTIESEPGCHAMPQCGEAAGMKAFHWQSLPQQA